MSTSLVTGLAWWRVDRLTRSPRELEDVIDLAERNGVVGGRRGFRFSVIAPSG